MRTQCIGNFHTISIFISLGTYSIHQFKFCKLAFLFFLYLQHLLLNSKKQGLDPGTNLQELY